MWYKHDAKWLPVDTETSRYYVNIYFCWPYFFEGRGSVRLYNSGSTSTSLSSGIVQIYYSTSSFISNTWGNICDDSSFASTEATVICRQLGYTGATTYGKAGNTLR